MRLVKAWLTGFPWSAKHFQLHDQRKLCASKIWRYTVDLDENLCMLVGLKTAQLLLYVSACNEMMKW